MECFFTDKEIVEGCSKGLRKYQLLLYELYAPKLMAISLRYIKNKTESEEVLQEGFVKIFKNINKFIIKDNVSVFFWMKRIVINTALNYIRDNKKYNFIESFNNIDESKLELFDHSEINEWIERYNIDSIINIIQNLPEGYRTVFTLYSIEEYSHYEISEQLGISINTSKTQLMKARRAIISKIEECNKKKLLSKKVC